MGCLSFITLRFSSSVKPALPCHGFNDLSISIAHYIELRISVSSTGYRLLAICASQREKLSPKSAGNQFSFFDSYNLLLPGEILAIEIKYLQSFS